jgi:hypothetical protein
MARCCLVIERCYESPTITTFSLTLWSIFGTGSLGRIGNMLNRCDSNNDRAIEFVRSQALVTPE